MINKDLIQKHSINQFTKVVKGRCLHHGSCIVKLRNKTLREVFYSSESFIGEAWSGIWRMDGSSITSSDYDMIEIKN